MSDPIDRQAAIDALKRKKDKNAKGDIGGFYNKIIQNDIDTLMQLPSAQSELEDKILAIGYTGKEGHIYIGGRLFAVRELAQ